MKPNIHSRSGIFSLIAVLFFCLPTWSAIGADWQQVGEAGFSPEPVSWTNLIVDNVGTLYMAGQDEGNSSFRVMRFDGINWVQIGAGFTGASEPSLALDSYGTPYVAYRDWGERHKGSVMRFDGTDWVQVGVAGFTADRAYSLSLAIDSSGTPCVAYQDRRKKYKASVMKFDGTDWVQVGTAGFTSGQAAKPSLAFDSSNTPYVAYIDDAYEDRLSVMKFDGIDWVQVGEFGFTSDGIGLYPRLAVGSDGMPYVAYPEHGADNDRLSVMRFDGNEWIQVGPAGFTSSAKHFGFALDSSNIPHVAYTNSLNPYNAASVMKFDGNEWAQIGTAGFTPGMADFPYLAIDSKDDLYVSYSDEANDRRASVMKFASSTSPPPPQDGDWQQVGNAGFTPDSTSFNRIAVDSSGTPYAAYTEDAFMQRASVMKFDGTNWQQVGARGFTPEGTEVAGLAFDSADIPYVAYIYIGKMETGSAS
ncbi:hypothetical protein VU04_01175 [Desulfobulbus sp. TB]|nr:hypothetical protein [Desulfobulbus sp. TB]